MKQNCTIGIDLGGTKTAFALISNDGNILKELRIDTNTEGGEFILNDLLNNSFELYNNAKEMNLEVKGIGIGSPGRVDTKNGIVVDCTPNLKNWQGINIKSSFSQKFDLPVFIDNDANVAAFGEYYLRRLEGKNEKTIIILTLGTGLGSGIIYNQNLFRGRGLGSEIGHMIIDTKGRKCNCGQTGCFEMYVCGTAIETQAKERLYKYPDSKLNNNNITSYKVFELARQGDLFCQIIIDEMAEYLSYGIISLINIFDPNVILLGGGISKQSDIYFNKIINIINKEINYTVFDSNIIQIAKSDEKAGLIGAGLIAFHGIEMGDI